MNNPKETLKRLDKAYYNMLYRTGICGTTPDRYMRNYIERGISVDSHWLGDDGRRNFREWSLEHGFSDGKTLDRINNDAGYGPDNCRWTSPRLQIWNRRNNRMMALTLPTSEISRLLGHSYSYIFSRTEEELVDEFAAHRDKLIQEESMANAAIAAGICPCCGQQTLSFLRNINGDVIGCPMCIYEQDVFSTAISLGLTLEE